MIIVSFHPSLPCWATSNNRQREKKMRPRQLGESHSPTHRRSCASKTLFQICKAVPCKGTYGQKSNRLSAGYKGKRFDHSEKKYIVRFAWQGNWPIWIFNRQISRWFKQQQNFNSGSRLPKVEIQLLPLPALQLTSANPNHSIFNETF